MTKSKSLSNVKDGKTERDQPKIPPTGFSRFSGNKGSFSTMNSQKFSAKAQFTPPAIRVTQNKGGN